MASSNILWILTQQCFPFLKYAVYYQLQKRKLCTWLSLEEARCTTKTAEGLHVRLLLQFWTTQTWTLFTSSWVALWIRASRPVWWWLNAVDNERLMTGRGVEKRGGEKKLTISQGSNHQVFLLYIHVFTWLVPHIFLGWKQTVHCLRQFFKTLKTTLLIKSSETALSVQKSHS